MTHEAIQEKLADILAPCKREEFEGVFIYLLNKKTLDEVLFLEAGVRGTALEKEKTDTKTKDPFYPFAKILNPKYPAFKYSFYLAHKHKEIFDRSKIKDAVPGEIEIWKNSERKKLEEKIAETEPPMSQIDADNLRRELEDNISIDEQTIKKLMEDFEEYDVVITSFEQKKYYPSIYFTLDTSADYEGDDANERQKYYKKQDTHLRKDVPNLLWFKDDRPFSELRANDKISRIIKTHTRCCGTIYMKKKEDSPLES